MKPHIISIYAGSVVFVLLLSAFSTNAKGDANDTLTTAQLVEPNVVLSGYLDYNSNRNDYYKVIIPNDGILKAKMSIDEFWEDLDLQIYNSAGTKIASSETIWTTEECELNLNAGTYYIRVFAYGSRDDSEYTLKLDYIPNNLPQLTIGLSYSYSLSASNPVQYFKVKGSGNTLVVDILGPNNANYNLYIRENGLPTENYYDDKSTRPYAEESVQVEPDDWFYVMVKRVTGTGTYHIRAHDYEYHMLLDMWEFDRTPLNEDDLQSLGAPKFFIENWNKLPFKSQEESAYWVNYVNSFYSPAEAWTYSSPFPTTKCLSYSASTVADWWLMKKGVQLNDYTSFVHGGKERGTNPRTLELIFQQRHNTDPTTYVYFSNISIVGVQVWNEKDPVTKEYTPYSLKGYANILTHPPSETLIDPITGEAHVVSSTSWLYGLEVQQLTVSVSNLKNALHQNGIIYAQIEGPTVVEMLRPDGTHAVPIIGYCTKNGKTYFIYHDSYGLQEKTHGSGQVNIRAGYKMIDIDEIDEAYTFIPSNTNNPQNQDLSNTSTSANSPSPSSTPSPSSSSSAPYSSTSLNINITNSNSSNIAYSNIIISEFLPKPYSLYTKEWIELYNPGNTEIDLSNWKLDDKEGGSTPYKFPAGTKIAAHGYAVFFSNKTHITLNNEGDEVRLLSPSGVVVDKVAYTSSQNDKSFIRLQNGSLQICSSPTPLYPNVISNTNNTSVSSIYSNVLPTFQYIKIQNEGIPINIMIIIACAIALLFFALGRITYRRMENTYQPILEYSQYRHY